MEVIEGEAIALDRDQNRVHHLNEVATFILGICTGERTEAEIVAGVIEHFDIQQAVADADARELLTQMRALDIVV
jgi:hypothetical protein